MLLFISGLKNIDEETQLLKTIYEELKKKPREVEGYKKEDFKILWIPIVDDWNEDHRKTLETKLQRTKIGWYVVKHFSFETGIKLIKELFNYRGEPVIPLMSPEGKVENIDTKQIISMWGIDGFPFRTSDHTRLIQQWNWFWSEMTKLNPRIGDLVSTKCLYHSTYFLFNICEHKQNYMRKEKVPSEILFLGQNIVVCVFFSSYFFLSSNLNSQEFNL